MQEKTSITKPPSAPAENPSPVISDSVLEKRIAQITESKPRFVALFTVVGKQSFRVQVADPLYHDIQSVCEYKDRALWRMVGYLTIATYSRGTEIMGYIISPKGLAWLQES